MSPSSFSFKLSVPNDPDSTTIIGELARHAAEYAKLDATAAASFADASKGAATKAMTGGVVNLLAVFAAADGRLSMTIGSEVVSQPLS